MDDSKVSYLMDKSVQEYLFSKFLHDFNLAPEEPCLYVVFKRSFIGKNGLLDYDIEAPAFYPVKMLCDCRLSSVVFDSVALGVNTCQAPAEEDNRIELDFLDVPLCCHTGKAGMDL